LPKSKYARNEQIDIAMHGVQADPRNDWLEVTITSQTSQNRELVFFVRVLMKILINFQGNNA
jgi:hypothetical protein